MNRDQILHPQRTITCGVSFTPLRRIRANSRASRCLALVFAALAIGCASSIDAATTRTIEVTSTANAGPTVPGTLTWAIYQANYSGADINYINFNIPGVTNEVEITLGETLYIARPMIINATTQPGYAGQPLIRINCNGLDSGFNIVALPAGAMPPMSNGATANGGGSTIQGFRIVNYRSNGITLSKGADANVIADNYIGFAPLPIAGTYLKNVTLYHDCRGIGIQSNSNVIRGNTISGVDNGITVGDDISAPTGAVYHSNSFERNLIGTDPTGSTLIGNVSDGIFLGAGAQKNLIGPGNVLSGMLSAGVEILHATATENIIFGNMIGLNSAGTAPIPNGELGVLIANGASNNWIGGPTGGPYAGNVISGNALGGVAIGTDAFPGPDGSNNNHVEGNLIGTNGAGTAALGTQISGVTVQSKSKGNVIRKNVILGHVHHAIVFSNANSNAMYGNWLGMTSSGTSIPNGGFGVYVLNASFNTVQLSPAAAGAGTEQNFFGGNTLGQVGLDGGSKDNIVDLSSNPTPTPAPTATPIPGAPQARLLNISTRMGVETGENALIAGFIITGNSAKKVIVRAMGSSLPVDGAVADPTLELNSDTTSVFNDDWRTDQEQAILDSTIPPTSNLESAIVATLQPGAYTAVMRGKGNTTGVGLLEVYDLESSAPAVLANISTRGIVRTGDNVMIAGFILGAGEGESRIIVRALGPSLVQAGVSSPLNDPTLRLVDSNGTAVRESNNWQDDAGQAAELATLGIAPAEARESAVVAKLPPGAYTAVVADANGNTGTGLVEVYNVP